MHFTGHAVGNASEAAAAGLVLSAGTPGTEDLWSATELAAGNGDLANCRLAILSACESGRGTIRIESITDYSGVPAALLSVGVSAVIATLWAVPDNVAALFADFFYEQLSQQAIADLPSLVHKAARALRTVTGEQAAARLRAMRERVTEPRARLRLEAYARQLSRCTTSAPFAGPAAWASFYHTGTRFLRFGDAGGATVGDVKARG
jgi:CHAT domain-containing protein